MPSHDAPSEPHRAAGSAASATWFRRLGVDARPDECAVCLLLFLLHFLLLAFQYVGKSLRQSSFIDALGAEQLPSVYLAVALLSYPVLLLYGRLVRVFRLDRLLAGLTLLAAIVTVGFGFWFRRVGDGEGLAAASVAFYLWTAVAAILLVSLFWSLSSHVLHARQARRLFGFLGAGGLLGSIAGGQVARVGSHVAGASGALFLGAGLLALGSAMALVFGRRFGLRCERDAEDEVPSAPVGGEPDEQVDVQLRTARDGLGTVLRSSYLRRVSVLMLLAATVAQIVDLQFGWAVERATETLHQRTATFGNLYSVMGLAAFVFQLLFTSRIHRRFGVGFALRVLPVTNGLGAAAFLAAAFFAPAFVLPVLWAVKATENGLRYSLDQSTRELLFVPVPENRRPRAKAFVDVFVQRAAKGLAALLLLSVTFGWISVPATAWIALVCVVGWLAVLGTLQRHYVAGFRDGLVRRLLSGGAPGLRLDLRDGETLETLVAGLGSGDAREVQHSVELLDAHDRGHLVPPLMLCHDDPDVRLAVLGVLRRDRLSDRRRSAEPWVERLLSDPEPPVRVAAIRTLAALSEEDLRGPMEARLNDADPRVRAVAASYLATLDDPDLLSLADSSLAEMMADTDPAVRAEAARALGELDEPRFQTGIVQLLYDPDVAVVRATLAAVRDRTQRCEPNTLYMPTIISLLHRRRLKHEAREALAAYGEMAMPVLRHFLLDPQEPIWVRRGLPKTIARIGGDEALRVLVEALNVADSFQRRKVVEALTALSAGSDFCLDPAVLDDRIGAECREYLRHQLDLWSLESLAGDGLAGDGSHLLLRLLRDRLGRQQDLVFGLLALRHPGHDVATARRGLRSQRESVRAHAVEYLDNLTAGEVRQWVLSLIDDVPRAERIRQAQRLFGLDAESPTDTLRRLATRRTAGDADAAWLTAAALHFIQEHSVADLASLIRRAAERDRDPLVQETAGVLLRQAA